MIRIDNLHVRCGDFLLENINLHINKGEFFVLMGPTGAGKTILLEAVAGVVSVKSGLIHVDGLNVTDLPPEKHRISILYQDYALFPHLNVEENIRYGQRYRQVNDLRSKDIFYYLVKRLSIDHLLKRSPGTLSGGEMQRVALARALVVEPRVVLLDEPLSALDPVIREDISHMIKQIHKESGTTFVMVTHNFSEALTLASRAAVMRDGKIQQCGLIEDIFQRPSSSFVADFVGMKNVYPAEFRPDGAVSNGLIISHTTGVYSGSGYVAIRPEDVIISKEPFESSAQNVFMGTVDAVFDQGFFYELQVRCDGLLIKSIITRRSLFDLKISERNKVFVTFKATAVHAFT